MAPQRSHSIEFKRQVAQEFIAGVRSHHQNFQFSRSIKSASLQYSIFSAVHTSGIRVFPSYSSVMTIMFGLVVAASAITKGSALDLPLTVSTSRGWFPMMRVRCI